MLSGVEQVVWYNLTMRICSNPQCSTDISHKDRRSIYCSRSCAAKINNVKFKKRVKLARGRDARKSKVQKWLDGEWDGTTKEGLSKCIRQFLLKEAKYTCQDGRSGCSGWGMYNPQSGKICLTVDHLNGNAYDNRPENLKVMCPNCHAMTPTFGALNKGSGRAHRYAILV